MTSQKYRMLNKTEYASLQVSVSDRYSYFHNWQQFIAEMNNYLL